MTGYSIHGVRLTGGRGIRKAKANGALRTVRRNLVHQHPRDWHNDTGVVRQADAQGVGIVLMRPLTSGVFQRLMQQTFPKLDTLDVDRLLLNHVLSDPYVDVALVGGYKACLSEPRFVDLNNEISDDAASRLDLPQVPERYVRQTGIYSTRRGLAVLSSGMGKEAPRPKVYPLPPNDANTWQKRERGNLNVRQDHPARLF